MRTPAFIFALTVAFICGCASEHRTTGHGDVGQFILQKAEIAGAVPITTNSLPNVSEHWRYEVADDAQSITIYLPQKMHQTVQIFLLQAFGAPRVGPKIADDGKSGWCGYKLKPSGGAALLFRYDDKQTVVFITSSSRPF